MPNKEFITGRLINWSLSDTILRLVLPVGIAYGSDTELATEILLRIAGENPDALKNPEPSVVFKSFGDSSLDFQLRVFIPSIDYYFTVISDLNMAIDKAFRDADIEIAFPQRDIHIRSIQSAIPFIEKAE